MPARLTVHSRDKLKKLIPLLASDKDGEIVATANAIKRVLTSNGKDFHYLAAKLAKESREPKTETVMSSDLANKVRSILSNNLKLIEENMKLKEEIKRLNKSRTGNYFDILDKTYRILITFMIISAIIWSLK